MERVKGIEPSSSAWEDLRKMPHIVADSMAIAVYTWRLSTFFLI